MSSSTSQQSALWVSERLLISALHMATWDDGYPTEKELVFLRESGQEFKLESKISAALLSETSPGVVLVGWDIPCDTGIFRLKDGYPLNKHYISTDWLLERNDTRFPNIKLNSRVGCISFNARVPEEITEHVKREVASTL